jgi:hypothetical protein
MTVDARILSNGRVMVSQDPTIGDRRSGQGLSYVIQATDRRNCAGCCPDSLRKHPRTHVYLWGNN